MLGAVGPPLHEVAYVYIATGIDLGYAHREDTELRETRLAPLGAVPRMVAGKGHRRPSMLARIRRMPPLQPQSQPA
jgi:hypothetical protein